MSEETPPGFLDYVVDLIARAMDAIGLNGTRLRWKWNRKRIQMNEAGARTEVAMRSAKGKHKMCPGCRALVPRSTKTCPDCGRELSRVAGPGIGRMLSNLLPGASAATAILLLVNGFWFILMVMAQIKAGGGGGGGFSLFGGFDIELGVRFGAGLSEPRLLSDSTLTGGEWWRLVTPIFLHWGLLHFFFNSYVLLQLGPMVEQIYGTPRFWVIYLACGLAGSAVSQLPRFTITAGASGAIMGLMGLLLVYGWRRGGALGESLKAAMLRFGVYILIFSLLMWQRMDHLNHLGGFVCGALLAFVVPDGEYRSRGERTLWQVLSVVGVLLVLLAFYKVAKSALP